MYLPPKISSACCPMLSKSRPREKIDAITLKDSAVLNIAYNIMFTGSHCAN